MPESETARLRRRIIQYNEYLKDTEERYDSRRTVLLEAGDHAGAGRLMAAFAEFRRDYRGHGEAAGLRNAGVNLGTDMWHHWGAIAFDAERVAIAATAKRHALEGNIDSTDALGRSFRASLTAVSAAAFMVEGLFGAVCYFVPLQTRRGRRWVRILATLGAQFDLSSVAKLDQRIDQLFALRNDAAHPWVATKRPLPHPEGFGNTSVEVATYTAATATWSIDLATSILLACAQNPRTENRSATRWANGHLHAVDRLLELRGAPSPSVD